MVGQQPAVYAPPLVGPTVRRCRCARRGRAPGRSTRSASRSPTRPELRQRRRALADDVEVAGQHEHVAGLGDAVREDGRPHQLRVGDSQRGSPVACRFATVRPLRPRRGPPGRRAAPWPTSRRIRRSRAELPRDAAAELERVEHDRVARRPASSGRSRIAFAWPVRAERKRPVVDPGESAGRAPRSGAAAARRPRRRPASRSTRRAAAATRPAAPAGRARRAGPRSPAGPSPPGSRAAPAGSRCRGRRSRCGRAGARSGLV